MRKLKKIISMPAVTVAAFVLAAVLFLTSSIGGARAALTYYSETYAARVAMSSIGVTLNENGKAVSYRNYDKDGEWETQLGTLLTEMLGEDESVKLGKAYQEELSVTNSGDIGQYVRVSIHKYWFVETEKEGEIKNQEISPAMINLHLVNKDAWLVDEDATTSERMVLYYNQILAPGETTPLFADTLSIDGRVAAKVTQTQKKGDDGKTIITTKYDYDGYSFCVEAKVDAVQEHNAEDAIYSAWGRSVSVNNGTLSLK